VRFFAVFLAACLVTGASLVRAQAGAPSAAEPQATTDDQQRPPYDGTGRRDPFRPFIMDMHHPEPVAVTPLQRYEPGQLTVVATVWEMNPPRAMIEDSMGMGYIVGLGTPIGRNGGVVTAIEQDRVIVEEKVLDFYGKEQVNRIVMETPREAGPNQPGREQK
jgi:Tfp pilus assembly protein PilP